MRIYYSFLTVLLFLLSCEGEEIDFSLLNRSIKVNARIEGLKTRAANDTWADGDAIGIYMITSGSELSPTSVHTENAKYTTGGDGAFSPATVADDVKFPLDGTAVDFIAYYPHRQVGSSFGYTINVSDQSDQAAIDLLYSKNAVRLNKDSQSINLTFAHQLSKISVKLKTIDNSPLSDVAVALKGVYTKATFSLVNQSLKITASSKGKIDMKIGQDPTLAEAIVLPAADLSGASIEIVNGPYGYLYDLKNAANIVRFEPGYKYTYTVTLDTRKALEATATIANWTEGPGEAITLIKNFTVYQPVGEGTYEKPYTVEDVRNLSPANDVWIQGYIVGHYTGNTVNSFSNDTTNPASIKNSSIALGVSATETLGARTCPVRLSESGIKTALSLNSKPENLGKKLKLKGNTGKYFGVLGVQSILVYEFIPETP